MSKVINKNLGKGIFVGFLGLMTFALLKLYRPNYETIYFAAKKKSI
jgi:hypothetical protein